MKPATLKTLADAAGMSVSTISLALRKDGRVKLKTRLRIEQLARELNYQPNAAGAILAGYKSGRGNRNATIAVVTHVSREELAVINGYYERVRHVAKSRGYEAEHCPFEHPAEIQPLIRQLYHRGVAGVVLSHIRKPDINLFDYTWDNFSTVALLRTRFMCPYDLVTADAFYSMRECWWRVRERGYRRIGVALCRHLPFMEDDHYREGALAVCQNELSASETAVPPFLGLHGDEAGFLAWFRSHRPDAVIGFTLGHYWLLKSVARVPGKVSFVSLHTFTDKPEVSGCVRNEDLEISMAIDHIDLLIRHRHRGQPAAAREILVRPFWQEGTTLI